MVDAAPGTLGSPLTEIRTPPPAAPENKKQTIFFLKIRFFQLIELILYFRLWVKKAFYEGESRKKDLFDKSNSTIKCV
jgi:hypothetical protein